VGVFRTVFCLYVLSTAVGWRASGKSTNVGGSIIDERALRSAYTAPRSEGIVTIWKDGAHAGDLGSSGRGRPSPAARRAGRNSRKRVRKRVIVDRAGREAHRDACEKRAPQAQRHVAVKAPAIAEGQLDAAAELLDPIVAGPVAPHPKGVSADDPK